MLRKRCDRVSQQVPDANACAPKFWLLAPVARLRMNDRGRTSRPHGMTSRTEFGNDPRTAIATQRLSCSDAAVNFSSNRLRTTFLPLSQHRRAATGLMPADPTFFDLSAHLPSQLLRAVIASASANSTPCPPLAAIPRPCRRPATGRSDPATRISRRQRAGNSRGKWSPPPSGASSMHDTSHGVLRHRSMLLTVRR